MATPARRTLPFWKSITAIVVATAALTLAWRYSPLAEVVTAEKVIDWTRAFAGNWWAAPLIVASYTLAQVILFPRPLLTLAAVVAFGPWLGFGYAMTGILLATAVGYAAGRLLDRDTVRRIAGPRLDRLTHALRARGLMAMVAVRLVPIAPFAVESIVAGAIRLELRHVLAGTFVGMLPGTLTATVFGDQIETALKDPSRINWWLVGGVLLLLAGASYAVQRWFQRMERRGANDGAVPDAGDTRPRARRLLPRG